MTRSSAESGQGHLRALRIVCAVRTAVLRCVCTVLYSGLSARETHEFCVRICLSPGRQRRSTVCADSSGDGWDSVSATGRCVNFQPIKISEIIFAIPLYTCCSQERGDPSSTERSHGAQIGKDLARSTNKYDRFGLRTAPATTAVHHSSSAAPVLGDLTGPGPGAGPNPGAARTA